MTASWNINMNGFASVMNNLLDLEPFKSKPFCNEELKGKSK